MFFFRIMPNEGNGKAIVQMEQFDINSVDNVRQEFLRNRTVENATRILDRLVAIPIDVSEVDNRLEIFIIFFLIYILTKNIFLQYQLI